VSLFQDVIDDFRKTSQSRKRITQEDRVSTLAPTEAQGFRLPISYADDTVLLSDKAAWAGFEVPPKRWGFPDEETIAGFFREANQVFAQVFPAEKGNQGHLLITNQVHSPDDWERTVVARHADTAHPTFASFIRATREAINEREFFERDAHLFVRLGDRGPSGVRGFLRHGMEYLMLSAGLEDTQPGPEELADWEEGVDNIAETLGASWLAANPNARRRIEWLVRHLDTPGLPTPDTIDYADGEPWGIGWWRTVLASQTRVVYLGREGARGPRYHAVEIDAPIGDGTAYAAFLPLAYIPTEVGHHANWIHHRSTLDFPVDVSLRFEVLDSNRAQKEIQRPINDAEAQHEEDQEAGTPLDDVTQTQHDNLREVKQKYTFARARMAKWQAVFCVYDTDKKQLQRKIARLIEHYQDLHMELVNPKYDQIELFYQSFPGGEVEVTDWIHETDTEYLASAQPWFSSQVGDTDGTGLYQGFTIIQDAKGKPKRGAPVFYDLLNVVDDEGRAPTEVVAGDSGSGKTVSRGLKSAFEDYHRGVTQTIWDPKGDFFALLRYAQRLGIDPRKIKLVDLLDPATSVSLDPFGTAEVDLTNPNIPIDDRESAVVDTMQTLLDRQLGHPGKDRNLGERIIRNAVRRELAKEQGLTYEEVIARRESPDERPIEEEPCLQGVRNTLAQWVKELPEDNNLVLSTDPTHVHEVKSMVAALLDPLETFANTILGRHLFRRPSSGGSLNINQGDIVLFVAINMTTTPPGEKQTEKTVLSDVISGMMTDYIRSMLYMLPDQYVKSATFDEWHVIKRSGRSAALLQWLRRMGRSKRCMVRQLSQSANDFAESDASEPAGVSMSTIWCGWVESEAEAKASCALLGITPSPANISLLLSLRKGQFLFRDAKRTVAYVQVDIIDDDLLDMFSTDAKNKTT